MLSYKHGYHAGNEADVLKHICLIQAYISLKDTINQLLMLTLTQVVGFINLQVIICQK